MLSLIDALQMIVLNCIYIIIGVTVATYIMPYLVGKRMIRGMIKAGSEVFDERARELITKRLGETLNDPNIRNVVYHIFLKLMADSDIMSMITGTKKED